MGGNYSSEKDKRHQTPPHPLLQEGQYGWAISENVIRSLGGLPERPARSLDQRDLATLDFDRGYQEGVKKSGEIYMKNANKIALSQKHIEAQYMAQINELEARLDERAAMSLDTSSGNGTYDRFAVTVIDGQAPCFQEMDKAHSCLRDAIASKVQGKVLDCSEKVNLYTLCTDQETKGRTPLL